LHVFRSSSWCPIRSFFTILFSLSLHIVDRSCEHGNEPSGSIKGGEFISWLAVWLSASQEGLCSMELVGYSFFPYVLTTGNLFSILCTMPFFTSFYFTPEPIYRS
jgi:hypothetical protein